jgi:hypothetical protein|nr:MAG TPA: hypothetical protein [Caudoviricetes sp.]
MTDHLSLVPSDQHARRQELKDLITLCLREADALNLPMTGIHLNDALESLRGLDHIER